jgi:hypothetical protein
MGLFPLAQNAFMCIYTAADPSRHALTNVLGIHRVLDGLSTEEIAAIQAKRKAKIGHEEATHKVMPGRLWWYRRVITQSHPSPFLSQHSTHDRSSSAQHDHLSPRSIKEHERPYSDRNSVLDLNRRQDFSFVLEEMEAIRAYQKKMAQPAPQVRLLVWKVSRGCGYGCPSLRYLSGGYARDGKGIGLSQGTYTHCFILICSATLVSLT